MAKGNKPKAGSRAFWPRKRAKRIYPKIRSKETKGEVKPLAFAGYKAGMTQVSYTNVRGVLKGQEITKPVTVLDCPPLIVCGVKLYQKTLYGLKEKDCILAEKLDKNLGRKISVPKNPVKKDLDTAYSKGCDEIRLLVHTKPKESGLGKKKPELFEIDLSGDIEAKLAYAKEKLGQEITPEDVFKNGEYLDVRAVSTGKGFQGPVKRFGIKIRTRKNKNKRRHTGPMGSRTPGRVLPGKIPQAGQHGFHTRTEYSKKLLQIETGNVTPKGGFLRYGVVNGPYILIEGSVPGPKKRLIMLRKSLRKEKEEPVKISKIFLDSQQGL